MKKIVIILLSVLISIQVYSQTAVFHISDTTVFCEILDKDGNKIAESDTTGVLDYNREVKEIVVYENPILSSVKLHSFYIGGSCLEFAKTTQSGMRLKEHSNASLKKPITLQPGDVIKINNELYDFYISIKKLTSDEVLKDIKITNVVDTFKFTKKKPEIFEVKIDYPTNINLSNIDVLLDEDVHQSQFDKGILTYEIDPNEISDQCNVSIRFDAYIKGQKLNGLKKQIGTIEKDIQPRGWLYGMVIFIIVFIVVFFFTSTLKKWRKASIIEDADSKTRVKIICNGEPQVGDLANKEGEIQVSNGTKYVIKKNSKFGKAVVKHIYTPIKCKNEDTLYVDFYTYNEGGSSYCVESADGQTITLCKGMATLSDGEFVLSKKCVVHVKDNVIDSVVIRIYNNSGQYIEIDAKNETPSPGDSIMKADSDEFKSEDGVLYEFQYGKIVRITTEDEARSSKLKEELENLKKENRELKEKLKKLPNLEEYENLKNKIQKFEEKVNNLYYSIEEARATGKAEGKFETERKYKRLIGEDYISIVEHNELVKPLLRQREDAVKAKHKAEERIKEAESNMLDAGDKITALKSEVQEKSEALIRQNAANAQLKEIAHKKNMHYIFLVQEALKEISETFKDIYKDIINPQIRDGFINPMLRGVSGLSTGIHSWAEDFIATVIEEPQDFFGEDFLLMEESEVKEILSKKFISKIIKSDSFSKFIRLYQLSTVPFIRKQFIEAQLNISTLNRLYYKIYSLVTDFGYTIICPSLFEEQYSESKYQWFNSTNLFTIIDLPEDEKKLVKGSETIIDINQIGFTSKWANRKATAVTPDF